MSSRETVSSISLAPPQGTRLLYLDACRASFILLGIFLHAALPFTELGWELKSARSSKALEFLFFVITSFRMPGFFVIAGLLSGLTLPRYGARAWIAKRASRLGVPLILAVLFVVPLQSIAVSLPANESSSGVLRAAFERHTQFGFHLISHLWFILDLLIICVAFVLLSLLPSLAPLLQMVRKVCTSTMLAGLLGPSVMLLLLAVYLPLVHWLSDRWIGGYVVLGGDPLWGVIDGWRLLFYMPFFALGVLLAREPKLLARFIQPSLSTTATAIICLAIFVWLNVQGTLSKYAPIALIAPCGILLPRVFMQLANRTIRESTQLVRWGADASYTIYVVHHPIVMFSTVAAIYLNLGALTGFTVVVLITAAASVTIYLVASKLLRDRPNWYRAWKPH